MPSTMLQQAKKKISGGFNSWRKKHKERVAIDTSGKDTSCAYSSGKDALRPTRSWTWRPLDFEPTTPNPLHADGQRSPPSRAVEPELMSSESAESFPNRDLDGDSASPTSWDSQSSPPSPSSSSCSTLSIGGLDGDQFINQLFSDFLPLSDDNTVDGLDEDNSLVVDSDWCRSGTPENFRDEAFSFPGLFDKTSFCKEKGRGNLEKRRRIAESVSGAEPLSGCDVSDSEIDDLLSSDDGDDSTLLNFTLSTDEDLGGDEEYCQNHFGNSAASSEKEVRPSEVADDGDKSTASASQHATSRCLAGQEAPTEARSMLDLRGAQTSSCCPRCASALILQERRHQRRATLEALPSLLRNVPAVDRNVIPGMQEGQRLRACSSVEVKLSKMPNCVCSTVSRCKTHSVETSRADASMKVCHHPQCSEDNHDKPLLLCRQCDLEIHRRSEFSGHLVLDATNKRLNFSRNSQSPVESDSAEDCQQDEDTVDGANLFVKKPSKDHKRNKSPSEVERKLKRKKAVKKKSFSKHENLSMPGLEAALQQIACPEGPDLMASAMSEPEGEGFEGGEQERRDSYLWDSVFMMRQDGADFSAPEGTLQPPTPRTPVRRQSRITLQDSFFTIKGCSDGDEELVAAVQFTSLREALEPVLSKRGIDINAVNVFIEKSKTPLPLTSDSSFLAGNVLEVKEKDERDVDMVSQVTGKQRPSSAPKASSGKTAKSSGRSSRRDSVGVVASLLEPPPTKQRRGSLQLPFREHFFNSKGDNSQSKSGDVRLLDDPFGSLRSRRGPNLSVDDTHTVPSTSPQGTLTFSDGKKVKQQKLSVVSLFANTSNKDREKHEQLQEILGGYSNSGIPPLPELLSLGQPKFDETVFQIEGHWSSLVDNASALTKRQHDQQEAIWELLQTELSYISQIRVIIDVFQNCLLNIQQESLLNEIETERLFSNIDQVLICNCRLWQDSLVAVLEDARKHRHPLNPSLLKPAFLSEFKKLIGPYTTYCMEQKQCAEYMKSRHSENDLFKIFVLWAEAQKQCNRLKLTDLLVKPVQRITKYSLLLQAILRKTEDERQRRDLLEMISSVDECVVSINSKMQYQLDMERLEAIMTKIEPYDCVEPPSEECVKIIQEHNSRFNLMTPVSGLQVPHPRSLLMHSNLRLKESQIKTDVDCFLFTDLILVCKSNKRMDKYKIFRPPMRLDQIAVSDLKDKGSFLLIYMNEYEVPVAAYTFHGDQTAVRLWLDKIREAQSEYHERKMEDQRVRASRPSLAPEQGQYSSSLGKTPLSMEYQPPVSLPPLPRSASMDSTEGQFIPNIVPPKTSKTTDESPSSGIHSAQVLERVGSCSEISFLGTGTARVLDQERHASSSPEFSPLTERKHKPVKASYSVPNIHGGQLMRTGDKDSFNEAGDNRGVTFDDKSVSAAVGSLSLSPSNLMDQNSFDDDLNSRLNKPSQRRVSRGEKRYYTADSIQELRQEKDSSIHKRLSWQNENHLDERLRRKVLSSESVHSVPSSSGVSSSGSLHLNPESDISEETEAQKTGESQSFSSVDSSLETDTSSSVTLPHTPLRTGSGRAQSSSDIVELLSSLRTGEQEEGISSVNLPEVGTNKKFSPSELLIVKNHLLLDASVEASEV